MKNLIIYISLLGCAQNIAAQADKFDSAINSNKYIINHSDAKIAGTGVDFLLKQTLNSQFVLIGENHNTKEIPQFTNALFQLLKTNYGFEYLALEQDPVMMKTLSNQENPDVFGEAKKYPYGFTFITDQELGMIRDVIASSKTKNTVWGCDQSFGSTQAIQVIIDYLRTKNIHNATIDSIYLMISKKEAVRNIDSIHYMNEKNKTKDLVAIKNSIPKEYLKELDFYINSLLLSDSLYEMNYRIKYFESNSMRENYMKDRFLEEYNLAEGKTPMPKVILKFGNIHLEDGFNSIAKVTSLGNFVRALAMTNHKSTFSVNTLIYRTDSSDWNYFGKDPSTKFYKKIANNTSVSDWSIIDLRPLKVMYFDGKLKGFISKEEKQRWEDLIFGYDCLLLIGNGNDGDVTTTKGQY